MLGLGKILREELGTQRVERMGSSQEAKQALNAGVAVYWVLGDCGCWWNRRRMGLVFQKGHLSVWKIVDPQIGTGRGLGQLVWGERKG